MKKILAFSYTALLIFAAACSTKENFADVETIDKNNAFRVKIKTGNFIKLSDGFTYYEYENMDADTVLVMVHGFSVPSYIWDSTYQAAIKRGYGALRYDTYGRGNSDNPDVVYDVALFSNQLKELLDVLKIKRKINLLGLSNGGRTISAFAFQYPERIMNLIYVDAAGFETITDTLSNRPTVSDEEIQSFKTQRYPTMAVGQMGDFYDSTPFKGWNKKYEEVMKYRGFVRALISTTKNTTNLKNEQRRIAGSGIPVFAIWGQYDAVVKLADIRANMMERIPSVKLFIVPKAGHLPHMEQPEVFDSILFDEIIRGKEDEK
ncbi:MAG: alpha/beta hydrolase [Chryseolinea sp.]